MIFKNKKTSSSKKTNYQSNIESELDSIFAKYPEMYGEQELYKIFSKVKRGVRLSKRELELVGILVTLPANERFINQISEVEKIESSIEDEIDKALSTYRKVTDPLNEKLDSISEQKREIFKSLFLANGIILDSRSS